MSIKLSISSSDPLYTATDIAVVGVLEGAKIDEGFLKELSDALGPVVAKNIKRDDFTGKKDQVCDFHTNGAIKPGRVVVMGLGKGPLTDIDARLLAARAARLAQSSKASSLAIRIPSVAGAERAAAEGSVLGAYRFTRYFTGDRVPKVELDKIVLLTSSKVTKAQRDAVALGEKVGRAVCIARDLINEPPNELYPGKLAEAATKVAKDNGLEYTVLNRAGLEKKGMKLFVAVGRGSEREPHFVHLTYKPKGKAKKKLVFVGKGLTFDSGGICIKPAAGMEEMKGDMGGAANIVALMAAVAAVKPQVEVHGLIGCAENMPDGASYRPGDIFGSLDGKKVEIINTDAEGRLVLADCLAYGRDLKPDFMLCNATLTGACVVALGPTMSGYYANKEELAERMKKAVKASGEAMWHMPLIEELREGLKSDWADIKHTADRWGGSITAALFLREFVGDTNWIHVDIAGPSMSNKVQGLTAKGGTGHGVLTYLKLIDSFAAD